MKVVKERQSRAGIADDVIPAFFESIAGSYPEVPETISGSLRFDLKDGGRKECWRVTFTKGVVSCARSNARADCVVHTDNATLEAIIQGRSNAMAALLRGALRLEGKALLLGVFRGLLTKPVAMHEARRLGRNTGRRL